MRSFALSALFAVVAAPAYSQSCGTHIKGQDNQFSIRYATATVSSLADAHGLVVMSESGVAYAWKADPFEIAGKHAHGSIHLAFSRGRTDFRDHPNGESDTPYSSLHAGYGVEQPISMIQGLSLCGSMGGGLAFNSFEEFPEIGLHAPVALGFGYSKTIGGLTVIPHLTPALAYLRNRYNVHDENGAAVVNVDEGADFFLTTGISFRIGKLILDTGYRFSDHSLDDARQLRFSADFAF